MAILVIVVGLDVWFQAGFAEVEFPLRLIEAKTCESSASFS